MRLDELILPARVEPALGNLKLHTAEVGTRYVLVDHVNFPRTRLYMMIRAVKNLVSGKKQLEDHVHDVDHVMTFIGDNEDLTGLEVEIHFQDEVRLVQSPFSVYIPAGLEHGYRFARGSGKYINVVMANGGDYNAVTR